MSSFGISVCLLLLSVFISSVSQIILKKAADKTYESTLKEYMNPMVIGAYGLFFCSVILIHAGFEACASFHCHRSWNSTGYIFVSVMGYIFLKERFSRRKLYGLCPDTCRNRLYSTYRNEGQKRCWYRLLYRAIIQSRPSARWWSLQLKNLRN